MLKKIALSTALLITVAAPAALAATTINVKLKTVDGTPDCAGLKLTLSNTTTAKAVSTGSGCPGSYGGGFLSTNFNPTGVDNGVFKINSKNQLWTISLLEPGTNAAYLLDLKDKLWEEYGFVAGQTGLAYYASGTLTVTGETNDLASREQPLASK